MRRHLHVVLLKIAVSLTAIRSGSAENANNTVELVHPVQGEVLSIDTQYRVEWLPLAASEITVSIRLLAKNGQATTVASKIDIRNGAYDWKINDTIKPQDGYCIYLKDERNDQRLNTWHPFRIDSANAVEQTTERITERTTSLSTLFSAASPESNGLPFSTLTSGQIVSSRDDQTSSSTSSSISAIVTPLRPSSYASLLYSAALTSSSPTSSTSPAQTPSSKPKPGAPSPSTHKPQLEDTGILELEADLAVPGSRRRRKARGVRARGGGKADGAEG
ncbi:hypothetical protein PG997_015005 [Apiospora hydei]|uniref:Yeast cell wall synthesis Kre9/Knh1-like N-terminal domain-containing protein n=1 Tax=Apiospora hydei TaxID=1337664 RepID=A0ABR1UVF9_9PEZI